MRTQKKYWPFIVIAFVLLGCATALTPTQQTLWATNVYLAQYDLYLEQVINPMIGAEEKKILKADPTLIAGNKMNQDLSDKEREILRVKKEILVELKPIIEMLGEYRKTGTVPPAEVQKKLTDLINQLLEGRKE